MSIRTFLLNMLSIVFSLYKEYSLIYNKFTIPSCERKYCPKQRRQNASLVDNFLLQILFSTTHYTLEYCMSDCWES